MVLSSVRWQGTEIPGLLPQLVFPVDYGFRAQLGCGGRAVSEPRLTFPGQGGATSGAKAPAPPLTRPGTGLRAVLGSVSAVRWYCELGASGSGQCGSAALAETQGEDA